MNVKLSYMKKIANIKVPYMKKRAEKINLKLTYQCV